MVPRAKRDPAQPFFTPRAEPRRTGIERMTAEAAGSRRRRSWLVQAPAPEVTERARQRITSRRPPCRASPAAIKLPPSSLLHRPDEQQAVDADELKLLAQVLTEKYAEFEVHGQVTQINPGPVVTTFEFKPEAGIKYSRITNLTDDLCLALKAESILIERMAGKSTVGIQVPNREREIIWLRENIESTEFIGSKSKLTLALGKDINGRIVDRRSQRHAAPADRRLDRRGQERGHQRHDHVDPVQGDARPGATDSGRSQAAGTGQLRRRAASVSRRSSPSPSWPPTPCATRCARWSAG